MTRMADDYDGSPYGKDKVYCPKCKENCSRCTSIEAFRECVKWCESCDGTSRVRIPLVEVIAPKTGRRAT